MTYSAIFSCFLTLLGFLSRSTGPFFFTHYLILLTPIFKGLWPVLMGERYEVEVKFRPLSKSIIRGARKVFRRVSEKAGKIIDKIDSEEPKHAPYTVSNDKST